MTYPCVTLNVPFCKQRLTKSRSSFLVNASLNPRDFSKVSREQKIMPVVQWVQRRRFLHAIAILYFNPGVSGRTFDVPTLACCNTALISSRRFLEWNLVSASRKIRILPRDFFAPRFLAFETLRSLLLITRAYFFAFAAVASVQPLHTTMISAS